VGGFEVYFSTRSVLGWNGVGLEVALAWEEMQVYLHRDSFVEQEIKTLTGIYYIRIRAPDNKKQSPYIPPQHSQRLQLMRFLRSFRPRPRA
jgi:hypothetical protein